jgi:phage terminase large subunit GpA-like protein
MLEKKYRPPLDAFLGTLSPRERLTPAAWIERYAKVPDNGINPEPGPYRFDRTPFWREVLDCLAEPGVEEVNILAPTQVGKTTSVVNLLGYCVDCEPGAALLLLPDEMAAREYMAEKVLPFVKATPALARHLTGRPWDEKTCSVTLDTMPIFMGWAGSPMRAASRAVRYLICSEAHKFPAFSGKEADPISLGLKRVSNWGHRAKVVIEGTPTIRETVAYQRYEACADKRSYWVPCPHCGTFQVLSTDSLHWPDMKVETPDRIRRAERVEMESLAWVECCDCNGKISDKHKPAMLSAGKWASADQVVTRDGRVAGPRPASKRVAFHLHGLCSPWLTFGKLAAERIKAGSDPVLLLDFANSREARPFEQQIQVPTASEFEAKAAAAKMAEFKAKTIPDWAGRLLLTIDVQKAGFWCVWRAWGWKYRSRLVWHEYLHGGTPDEWDRLYRYVMETRFAVDAQRKVGADMVLIDSGGGTALESAESRTQEVYHFCRRVDGWLIPIKGNPHAQDKTVRASAYTKDARGNNVPLYLLAVDRLKSELMRRVRLPDGYDGCWELNDQADAEYLRQMCSEEEVVLDVKTGQRGWRQKHRDNHLWDCEVYQLAAAELAGVGSLPSPDDVQKAQQSRQPTVAEEERRSPLDYRGRW